ncbi:sugar ABC transporter ATP-binding protein [Pseudonocardia acaciae]|uniref:sugar ABC transporter ATP-binding protein n=1 Tax=Pseudonocardia acaciae TaxID=551276 RepID=UPI0006855F81|nr:sugar ABC transporter ATP-binding protein [Pseudonocardia acaciae]
MGSTVLEVRDIAKSYGPNRVLRGVSFGVEKGAIYGLMGANGAGKSTLIKILSGAEQPDGGRILLGGEPVGFPDPLAAQRAGVGTVYQNPNDGVVLDMTVAENLALDRLTDRDSPRGFSRARTERHALEVAETLGMHLTKQVLRWPARRLGVSDRQLLVLARALSRKPEILILDEPTSALSAEETSRLFDLVRSLVADGMTVLFVTHKLAEFDRLCHHVGVLRDGAMPGEFFRDERHAFDWPEVLTALFDRTPAQMRRDELPAGPTVLSLRDVQVFPDSKPFDLDLHRGQVTVLLGLLGSGKTELLEWIFGARPVIAGRRELSGTGEFAPEHPGDAVRDGVYLLPESRHEQAIIPDWPVFSQMTLPFLKRFSAGTLMRGPAERRATRTMMDDIGVVARDPSSPIHTLSGGNQQKVVIGRWLLGEPKALLLDEPFRGVDINARHDIGATVRRLTSQAAVLVATSDLDEALEVGDRIVVFNHGHVVADLGLGEASRERLIDAMSVTTRKDSA